MIKSFALGALLSLAAVAAQAAPVTVQLVQPLTKADTIVTGQTAWDCQGATCTAEAMSESFSVDTCRDLTRQLGVGVASYASANKSFDAARLARCNASLPGTVQAKAAPAPAIAR